MQTWQCTSLKASVNEAACEILTKKWNPHCVHGSVFYVDEAACLLGCLKSQQQSVPQGWIFWDNFTCYQGVLWDAASQVWPSFEPLVGGIFLLELTWVLTPFPKNSLMSSLSTHAFHHTDSKDPDMHALDAWRLATKTHPACTIHKDGVWLPLCLD